MKLLLKIRNKIIFFAFLLFPGILLAQNNRPASSGPIFKNPISKGDDIYVLVKSLLDVVVKVGTYIVIVMVIYSGFLFVKAQGNESAISEAKNTFLWTVIGGVVLIGASVLAGVVCNTAAGLGAAVNCSSI